MFTDRGPGVLFDPTGESKEYRAILWYGLNDQGLIDISRCRSETGVRETNLFSDSFCPMIEFNKLHAYE
jgi:hypothetical protein